MGLKIRWASLGIFGHLWASLGTPKTPTKNLRKLASLGNGNLDNRKDLSALYRIVLWYSVDKAKFLMSDRQIHTRPKKAGLFMGLAVPHSGIG